VSKRFLKLRFVHYLSITPALLIIVGLFGGGMILALVRALGIFPAYGLVVPTLDFFERATGSSWFLPSLALTTRVAALSTLIAVLAGTGVALGAALWLRPSWRLRIGLQLPLYLPHLIVANMLLVVFSQSGLVPRFLYAVGWISEMSDAPPLIYDEFGLGIALGLALKETPFVAVLVFPFASSVLETYGRVARTLGARAPTLLFRVVLPMTWPAVATAAIISFAYGFSSFEIPYVLGRTYPRTLSNVAYELYTSAEPLDRPEAIAIGVVIVLINAVLAVAYFAFSRRYDALLRQIRVGQTA